MSEAIIVSTLSSSEIPQELGDEKEEDDSWRSLPEELLSLILSLVYFCDYPKFRATCTSWRRVSPPLELTPHYPKHQSPCLLLHGLRRTIEFFNPMYNITYKTDISELSDITVYSFNHGWFLMGSRGGHNVFFLDPFTNARVEIPNIPSNITFDKICFTSSPTSSDCMVIGFEICLGYLKVGIVKRGEENWTIEAFISSKIWLRFHLSDSNPILYNGEYYCLDIAGNLGVLKPESVSDSWCIYPQRLPRKLRDTFRQSFIVESNGDILSVYVHRGRDQRVCVYKLDFSKMVWERIEDLGNRTLYISNTTSFSTNSTIGKMGNKIFFPKFNGKDGVFYSLVSKRYHTYGDDVCENPREIKELKEFVCATWVLPEFASFSGDDLKW